MPTYHKSDKVICNGYPGVIVRQYSENMYEVRLRAGMICTDQCDIKPADSEPADD